MDILSFAFGALAIVAVILIAVIIVGVVKVFKVSRIIEIERQNREALDINTQTTIDMKERDAYEYVNRCLADIKAYTDSKFDKVLERAVRTLQPKDVQDLIKLAQNLVEEK